MEIIHSANRMSQWSASSIGKGLRIGFVPTMGSLHEGHRSLIVEAQKRTDAVVVSVFVNPTQFAQNEDFDSYPRDLPGDALLCEKAGVSVLFNPDVKEMYFPDSSVFVEEKKLSSGLCGARRPGHFRGVTTVVAKLFNIVRPHVAVFGEKDAQQAAVIKRMVRDLFFPVEIVVAPTIRESNGLAMSSRNKYLSDQERIAAADLWRSLKEADRMFNAGERSASAIKERISCIIRDNPLLKLEYVEIVDANTLDPIALAENGALVVLAAHCGKTRLIDNIILGRMISGGSEIG